MEEQSHLVRWTFQQSQPAKGGLLSCIKIRVNLHFYRLSTLFNETTPLFRYLTRSEAKETDVGCAERTLHWPP